MILETFLSIVILFFLLLAVKSMLKFEICVICVSVSLTWLGLIFLKVSGIYVDPVLLGVLLGGSSVGVYYYVDSKVGQDWKIFRLPFLLTLFAGSFTAVILKAELYLWVLLLIIWTGFFFVYLLKNKQSFTVLAKKIVECCKNW